MPCIRVRICTACGCMRVCVCTCTRDLDLDKGPAEFATGVDEHEGAQAIRSVCPCPNLDAKHTCALRKPGRQAGESPLSEDYRTGRQARHAISIQSGPASSELVLCRWASVCVYASASIPLSPSTDRPTDRPTDRMTDRPMLAPSCLRAHCICLSV